MNQPQKHTGQIRLGQRTSEGASTVLEQHSLDNRKEDHTAPEWWEEKASVKHDGAARAGTAGGTGTPVCSGRRQKQADEFWQTLCTKAFYSKNVQYSALTKSVIGSPPEGAGILLKTEHEAERPTIKRQRPDKASHGRKQVFGDVHGFQSSQLKGAQDVLAFRISKCIFALSTHYTSIMNEICLLVLSYCIEFHYWFWIRI